MKSVDIGKYSFQGIVWMVSMTSCPYHAGLVDKGRALARIALLQRVRQIQIFRICGTKS